MDTLIGFINDLQKKKREKKWLINKVQYSSFSNESICLQAHRYQKEPCLTHINTDSNGSIQRYSVVIIY